MNATGSYAVRWLTSIVVILSISPSTTKAAAPYGALLVPSLLGQVGGQQTAPTLNRRQVDALLKRAQQAIRSGNLEQAEVLVGQAEAANVRYPLLHFGLRPQTVRRELTRARMTGAAKTAAGTPAQVASTTAESTNGPLSDPFAKSNNSKSQPAYAQLPTTAKNRMAPLPTPLTAQPSSQLAGNNPVAPTPQPLSSTAPTYPSTADARYGALAPLPNDLGLGSKSNNPFSAAKENSPESLEPPPSALDLTPSAVVGDLASEAGSTAFASDTTDRYGLTALPETAPPSPAKSVYQPKSPGLVAKQQESLEKLTPQTTTDRPNVIASKKSQALELMASARQALITGNLPKAEELARRASNLNIPEADFLPGEDRPSALAWDIQRARQLPTPPTGNGLATQMTNQASPAGAKTGEQSAVHLPEKDVTQNVQAASRVPDPANLRFAQLPGEANFGYSNPFQEPNPQTAQALELLQKGEEALRNQSRSEAREYFQRASQFTNELDPVNQQRLQGHLQMLSSGPGSMTDSRSPNMLGAADDNTQVLARQLQADITKQQAEARRIRESEPREALEMLQEMRSKVESSGLPSDVSSQLVRRIDISIKDAEQYIEQNRAEIELDEQNEAVLAEIERTRAVKVKVREEIALLLDKFNQLLDEQRFEEMEIVAQRLRDLAPDEPVVQQTWQMAKFIRREKMNRDLQERKEEGNFYSWNRVEESSAVPIGIDEGPIYAKDWDELTKNRRGSAERAGRMTERELEIQRRLQTPVQLRYEERPLAEVIDGLSNLTGVNIHLDSLGLDQEGVTPSTPVTINLSTEISLKSALNLILEPLHLSYVIKDEVLKITSEQLRDGELKTFTYNVADLVVPIPNFVPTNNIGLQGLLNDAQAAMGYGGGFGAPGPMAIVNNNRGFNQGQQSGDVLAQQFTPATGAPSPSVPIGGGPGGLGGGANADFDSLIDLIISTVATETWAENGGGEAEVRPFPTNLSLVVSQTQAVHEEIADLLEQLRRLQDLQVTIEVRFIRLNDDFFERIGIDFQLNIEDATGISTTPGEPGALTPGASFEPIRPSALVGIQQPVGVGSFPNYTNNLDIQFRQNSFDLTVPTIGGIGTDAAQFGFALPSDIEAYFLISAVQGDTRTNVLNAPKVTLFNGQQAFVADAVQMPFVISVIPVVGEFAAAQQPVIVVLSEGTLMSIQAVVSDDRRYVRLTVVPFFSDIGDVSTFTFEGSTTSLSQSSSTDQDAAGNVLSEDEAEDANVSIGTTVQLPTFQFVAVVTTVSVPDGGTVLLGGIKRLSEGRNERGVPLLSKIPYVNRLFRNVGIGRTTDSLMMMVTPRIIIQEEEEEKLGISSL